MFFQFNKHLQAQIKELQEQNQELRQKNDYLVQLLIEKPDISQRPLTAGDILAAKKAHQIALSSNSAKCTCGWREVSEDPGRLQELVSNHHRETRKSMSGGRRSWPQIKNSLENQAEMENKR